MKMSFYGTKPSLRKQSIIYRKWAILNVLILKEVSAQFHFSDVFTHHLLLAETKARLGIFYTDFEFDKTTKTAAGIEKIPVVNENKLRNAINGFKDVIKNCP